MIGRERFVDKLMELEHSLSDLETKMKQKVQEETHQRSVDIHQRIIHTEEQLHYFEKKFRKKKQRFDRTYGTDKLELSYKTP